MRALAVALLSAALLVWAAGSARAVPGEPVSDPLDPLVALVAQRLDTADAVAAAKWAYLRLRSGHARVVDGLRPAVPVLADAARDRSAPKVDDPEREAEVYDAMARLGAAHGLPENWVRKVFLGQIEASKTVQYGLIARWRFDPAAAPATPPDLTDVRPTIDRLNTAIIDQLAEHRVELAAPDCMERLAHGVFAHFATADPLHRLALIRAASALCR
ncbi:chorismate mutase [Nocardia amikacinitolerans]|uniref:Chorismate mutase n=1 Tax=Nocardia amikacinitolerans TaxID=756689 RepID=A0A285LQR2_9NOCA|nr:chorismate mutase [Nocardia amikacinitolerans]MCP2294846.1 chorismate mutase [Nocardia amikacinitolerans]SNY87274.1 chorismate mutase [Nocardia amikacinitolerans]